MPEKQLYQGAEFIYRAWLHGRGFEALEGQREMMRFVADVFGSASGKVGVVEAGTGTGKTIAYSIAGLLSAQLHTNLRLVIVTKTVALQEQIVHRDLPDLARNSPLTFAYSVAKGRNRYMCPKRLRARVQSPLQKSVFQEDTEAAQLYNEMYRQFETGKWSGDLDSWSGAVDNEARANVINDHRGCTKDSCEFRPKCPYFLARAEIHASKVIVTNYALLLKDLRYEAGVIPEHKQCLFVLDEAHNLPEIARSTFAQALVLGAIRDWSRNFKFLGTRMPETTSIDVAPFYQASKVVQEHADTIQSAHGDLCEFVGDLKFTDREDGENRFRLQICELPERLCAPATKLGSCFLRLATVVDEAHKEMAEALDERPNDESAALMSDWLANLNEMAEQAWEIVDGLQPFTEREATTPSARWIDTDRADRKNATLRSVLLDVGSVLNHRLWRECAGAVCTSATLSTAEGFGFFLDSVGLGRETVQLQTESPFDFRRNVTLHVPALLAQPPQSTAFVKEVVQVLPEVLTRESTALVLFTSKNMMQEVLALLPNAIQQDCLVQDQTTVSQLRRLHKHRVNRGLSSYIFGLSTMGEGIDLPGDLCRHVVVVRLPFAVPDDPIFKSREEWLEMRTGQRNPGFKLISLPEATLRLKQACGRLIRKKEDTGRITILDRRIIERAYGKAILDALPPYRRQIDHV